MQLPPPALEQRLAVIEQMLDPVRWRFLQNVVKMLKAEGESPNHILAKVEELMRELDEEAEDYEGEDDDD